MPYENDQRRDRPDICIGTDSYHTPREIEKELECFFRKSGYSVAINSPFAGAIVPLRYYRKDSRVQSIMIEINRRLYINHDGSLKEGYEDLKKDINAAVEQIHTFFG